MSGQEETVGGKQGTEVGDVCPASGRRREKQDWRIIASMSGKLGFKLKVVEKQ